jgi:hypothetical protein
MSLRKLALVALACYAVHATELLLRTPPENLLWSCNVAAVLVILGLATGSATWNAAGGVLLLAGEPVWIVDLSSGGTFYVTSLFTHVGVPIASLAGMRALGVPWRAWPASVVALASATIAAARWSSPEENVNVAVVTPPGWERFPTHAIYMTWLGTSICLGTLALVFVLRRIHRRLTARAAAS